MSPRALVVGGLISMALGIALEIHAYIAVGYGLVWMAISVEVRRK